MRTNGGYGPYEYVIIDSDSREELSDPTYLSQAQSWARAYKANGRDVLILHKHVPKDGPRFHDSDYRS